MRDARIVTRGCHPVVGTQLLIALGEVLLGDPVQVAECCRQTVAAMLLRHAAQRPQCVLQAFRERHHMGMLEARERQPEVVQPVIERLTRNRDAEPGHVGEVGQPHPSRRMLLAEDHIAVGTVERPPSGDAALQCPAHAWADPKMPTANLLKDRHRADAGCSLHHRHNLAVPHPGERVGTPASTRFLLLGWQPRICPRCQQGRLVRASRLYPKQASGA